MQLRMSVFQAILQAVLIMFTSGQDSTELPVLSSPSITLPSLWNGQKNTDLKPVWSSRSIPALTTQVLDTPVDAVFTSQSLPTEVLAMTVLQCAQLTECLPWRDCPVFSDQMERLRVTPWESLEYVEKIAELRTWVCNMKDKGVCCDTEERVELLVAGGPRRKCCP